MSESLTHYKSRLRRTILEFKEEYDLCDEGVNKFLGEMELPKLNKDWEYEYVIRINIPEDEDGNTYERGLENAIDNAVRSFIRSKDLSETEEYDLVELSESSEM